MDADLERLRRKSGRGSRFTMIVAGLSAAAAAVVTFFLDPDRGRGRRSQTIDRIGGLLRGAGRKARRVGRGARAETAGMVEAAQHVGADAGEPENDAVLAHKVESELFRDPAIPKGRMNINAENGVVVLRGTADSQAQIEDITNRVRAISGVRDVQNLLHLPDEPAPDSSPTSTG